MEQLVAELQALRADMTAIQGSLVAANTRAENAERERSEVIRLAAAQRPQRGEGDWDLVDGKGVGQPFKLTGRGQDFSEWTLKVVTFMKAKLGSKLEPLLRWAQRQKKIIVAEDNGDPRQIGYDDRFGELGDAKDKVENLERVVTAVYTYLISFTTGDANKIVRNSGSDAGLEAWRRLHCEYDPTSAMRRVTILGHVQEPPRCTKIEDLGPALEEWLTKKKQYEDFTDRHGNPCVVSEDSLLSAMYKMMSTSLSEQMLFAHDDNSTFEEVYDKLTSYVSAKHSLKLHDKPVGGPAASGGGWRRDPNAMEVDSFQRHGGAVCGKCGKSGHTADKCWSTTGAPSSSGGKPSGKGGNDRKANVQCWQCWQYGHYGKECPKNNAVGKPSGKGGAKGKPSGKKGGKFVKKPKGKGKGKKGMNAVDEEDTTAQEESGDWWKTDQEGWQPEYEEEEYGQGDSSLGAFDLNSVGVLKTVTEGVKVPYVTRFNGKQWLRFNYDSGAATTAVPFELAGSDAALKVVSHFKVASGEQIPDFGRAKMSSRDEHGNRRSIKGSLTKVHKPLGSASEFSGTHDCWLYEEGGVLLPKNGPVAKGLRAEYNRLVARHGIGDSLPIYREGNLYNFYLEMEPWKQLNPLQVGGSSSSSGDGQSGNVRLEGSL